MKRIKINNILKIFEEKIFELQFWFGEEFELGILFKLGILLYIFKIAFAVLSIQILTGLYHPS